MSDSLWPHGLYVTHQAPLSMGFPRQEYWNGLSFPSPRDLPNPGIEPWVQSMGLLHWQADSLPLSHHGSPTCVLTDNDKKSCHSAAFMADTLMDVWLYCNYLPIRTFMGFSDGSGVKNPPAVQDVWVQSWSGRSPGKGNGNPHQYSCPGNPMDRGAWRATVLGVAKSRTQLSD